MFIQVISLPLLWMLWEDQLLQIIKWFNKDETESPAAVTK